MELEKHESLWQLFFIKPLAQKSSWGHKTVLETKQNKTPKPKEMHDDFEHIHLF